MVWKTLHFISVKAGYSMGFLLGVGSNWVLLVLEAQVRGGSHQSEPFSHMSHWGQDVGGMGRKMSAGGLAGKPLLPCPAFYLSHPGLPP